MIDGKEAPDADFQSYVVERDMNQPDMAAITLTNQGDTYTKRKIGAKIEIKVGDGGTSVFQGEIVGLEPIYSGKDGTKITIRAINNMHKLLRMTKSITFTNQTDKDIISKVAQEAGLSVDWKHESSITYKHVYQHNLNGLEFVRMRAARLGCHVWCVGDKLFVKEPDLGKAGGLKVSVDEAGKLKKFSPRLTSAGIVKKVTVRGWNPETKELIEGTASATSSPLGSQNAVAGSGDHGKEETFMVDQPIWSKEEATALAKARLRDLSLTYITGEAELVGEPKAELGTTIEITANAMAGDDPFNGKYYIMGITHRHTMPKGKDGGYVTILRLARDAQGG
ncbi:MAG: phage late control D family protein [Kofleriaceae bacterium]